MNKINRYVQNYLICGFPFVALAMMGGDYITSIPYLLPLLTANMLAWIILLALFSISLTLMPSVRESAIRRLANVKERDEREVQITGRAARAVFMSTLALTLTCLFFSLFSVNLSRIDSKETKQYKHSLGVGVNYSLFKDAADTRTPEEKANSIFDTRDFAPSAASLILLFLVWQLATFRWVASKE